MHKNNDGPCRTDSGLRLSLLACSALLLTACQSAAPLVAAAPEEPAVVAEPVLEPVVLPALAYREPIVEPDLLVRLRSEFALPQVDDASVAREVAWYARNQAYLDRVFARGELYLHHIAGALEERHMPAELALLPIVESAFDPFAYSHGRAAGLWQIIPGTGRRLGLRQNWWYDGRRDVLEATRAALDYLQELHAQFNGDWLLAVAGYNSGEGNVSRALRKAAAEGRSQDFWGIRSYLPPETRTYVPRLLAIAALVASPAEHGVTLPALRNEARFSVVDTGGQIDLALAARLAGIDTDELYALNAGFNRWATDPDGPHRLLVPVTRHEQFASELAALGERERVQWTRHRVRPGETIGGIADRYHTTVAVLREVNGLRGTTIRAGADLMIPHAVETLASYTQSAAERAARVQSAPRGGQRRTHAVAAGETLWSIAGQYGVDVRSLAKWNAMAPGDVLGVGREIIVWTDEAATASTAASTPAAAVPQRPSAAASLTPAERIRQITYVVRRGDSLSSIARRFRVSVSKLVEWNAGAAAKYLQPGQRLTMFINVTEQSG